MECPKCKGKTAVFRTVYNPWQQETYRHRYCKDCDYMFYTVEYEIEETEKFKADWKKHINYR